MSEYSIEFAQQMAIAGKALLVASPPSDDRDRAVLYISLVACEIALKSALEQAGKSIQGARSDANYASFAPHSLVVMFQRQYLASNVQEIIYEYIFRYSGLFSNRRGDYSLCLR